MACFQTGSFILPSITILSRSAFALWIALSERLSQTAFWAANIVAVTSKRFLIFNFSKSVAKG